MARKYKVEGTKAFLLWGAFLLVLGLLGLKDGWFPSEQVLKKHPDRKDHFYAFNKTLAVLAISAAGTCFYIHRVVR